MNVSPKAVWDQTLLLIKENVAEKAYNTWFKPLVFESFNPSTLTLLVQVPSPFVYEYLEEHYVELLSKCLRRTFGSNVRLAYRVVVVKDPEAGADIEASAEENILGTDKVKTRANQSPSALDATPEELDPQLDRRLTFMNYIEGDSNKLPRSIGYSIAEHPNTTQFNPLFIYGPSGCGKTHLVNAVGMRTKQLYPQKRVLYISAKLFQVQYTSAVLNNSVNDFINFYQTIDMLIVDDVQEWMDKVKTLDTFFHIFNHLFKNGKRIILASDRPPVELKGMPDRLLTRFSCGLIAELEKPNTQLCKDILMDLIRRDGLQIPEDVVDFIAENADGSVRDLHGVINGLLAYSITYGGNINIKLAESVVKRAVKIDDKPLTVDDIVDTVCKHYNVTQASVNGKSRKHEYVIARQVSMYLAQKYTKMPAKRIGKLVGNRDHSTVIHSCTTIERLLKVDHSFCDELTSIENSFKLK
jgi:chromosomal replication initiator protein